MKNPIQMTETKKTFISFLLILGAVTIFTAPLLHIFFPKKPDYQVNFENKIDKFNENKDLEFCALKESLNQGKISSAEFIKREEQFIIDRAVNQDLLNYQLKNLIDENRIMGWKSIRMFLIGFGIRLPYLFFSSIILIFFFYSKEKLKEHTLLYRATKLLYTMSFLISFYMTIWFILPRDLPKPLYHLLISVLSVASTICAFYCIRYYYNKKSEFLLAYKIKELIHFITKSRKTTLDIAIKASEPDPDLKDIANKLGEYDEELEETMSRVFKNKVKEKEEVEF